MTPPQRQCADRLLPRTHGPGRFSAPAPINRSVHSRGSGHRTALLFFRGPGQVSLPSSQCIHPTDLTMRVHCLVISACLLMFSAEPRERIDGGQKCACTLVLTKQRRTQTTNSLISEFWALQSSFKKGVIPRGVGRIERKGGGGLSPKWTAMFGYVAIFFGRGLRISVVRDRISGS